MSIRAEPPETERGLRVLAWDRRRAQQTPWLDRREDGHYYYGDRRIVQEGEADAILEQEFRNIAPSMGYLAWYSKLVCSYLGIRRSHVKSYLDSRVESQVYRRMYRRSASKAIVSRTPGKRWACDIKILPQTYYRGRKCIGILVLCDVYSKFVFAYSIKAQSYEEAIRCFDSFFVDLGQELAAVVDKVQTDNATCFGVAFTDYLRRKNISHLKSDAYRPSSNGLAERTIQTLSSYLTSFPEQHLGSKTRWPEVVDKVVALYNDTFKRILKKSPREVLYAPRDPELVRRLEVEAMKRRNSALYTDASQVLQPGDHVRLSLRISGPSRVKDEIKSGTYKMYKQTWDDRTTYVVRRRVDTNFYELEGWQGRYDRLDLLRVPTPIA
jgi:hypothetical protein